MMKLTGGSQGVGQHMAAMYNTIQEAILFMNEATKFRGGLREYRGNARALFTKLTNQIKDISDETILQNLNATRATLSGNNFSTIITGGDELLKECGLLQTRLDAINAKIKAAKPMTS